MPTTNLYTVSIPPMIKALMALSKLIDKASAYAETKAISWVPAEKQMEALIHERLVFDQLNFIRQVQVACDNAKGAVARLGEIEVPKFEDNEKTASELKARIEKTLEILKNVKPEQIMGKEEIKVTLPYFPGKYFTGFEYVTEYLLPNFYFHVTTAYSILRKNGVPVGKEDFMGGLSLKDLSL